MKTIGVSEIQFPVEHYDLDATLRCGQAFRWKKQADAWTGVIGHHWVKLKSDGFFILAETAQPVNDWKWLQHYLQLEVNLGAIVQTFPDDIPMRAAKKACQGLRLLRQDPWECLASFILSSTKQIVQIQQIVSLICERFGEPLPSADGTTPAYSFPSAGRLARCSEKELRECKMGFRAPYLRGAALAVASGEMQLGRIGGLPVDIARGELTKLHGVGRKIADCVLLFAYGFPKAFPVDVWVMKALRQLYFPRRKVKIARLQSFAETHFGPFGGYAQQYLFHHIRLQSAKNREHKPG